MSVFLKMRGDEWGCESLARGSVVGEIVRGAFALLRCGKTDPCVTSSFRLHTDGSHSPNAEKDTCLHPIQDEATDFDSYPYQLCTACLAAPRITTVPDQAPIQFRPAPVDSPAHTRGLGRGRAEGSAPARARQPKTRHTTQPATDQTLVRVDLPTIEPSPTQPTERMIGLLNAISCGKIHAHSQDSADSEPAGASQAPPQARPINTPHSPTPKPLISPPLSDPPSDAGRFTTSPRQSYSEEPSRSGSKASGSLPSLSRPDPHHSSGSIELQPPTPVDGGPPKFREGNPFKTGRDEPEGEEGGQAQGRRFLTASPQATTSSSFNSPNLSVHSASRSASPSREPHSSRSAGPYFVFGRADATRSLRASQRATTVARPRPARGPTARRSTRTRPRPRMGKGPSTSTSCRGGWAGGAMRRSSGPRTLRRGLSMYVAPPSTQSDTPLRCRAGRWAGRLG